MNKYLTWTMLQGNLKNIRIQILKAAPLYLCSSLTAVHVNKIITIKSTTYNLSPDHFSQNYFPFFSCTFCCLLVETELLSRTQNIVTSKQKGTITLAFEILVGLPCLTFRHIDYLEGSKVSPSKLFVLKHIHVLKCRIGGYTFYATIKL